MRQVLSVSLPTAEMRQIKNVAARRGYSSVSSYVQHLFHADKDLISETELLQTAQSARREYRQGRSIKAGSIADLI